MDLGQGARRIAANIAPASGYTASDPRHHLSGGAQGPDPVHALLQAGPPDAVQPRDETLRIAANIAKPPFPMSAFGGKADIQLIPRDVCF
jgi:hypothetical protein